MTANNVPNKEQLNEVYNHLDHYCRGNQQIAYYGQLRAEEYTHAEALEMTIVHFGLRHETWYNKRFEPKEGEDKNDG